MSEHLTSPLFPMLRKLERWGVVAEDDRVALLSLPHSLRIVEANQAVVREGCKVTHTCLLRSGFVHRFKVVADGGRQILSIQMAGELVDLENSMLDVADHGVQAISQCELALIPVEALLSLASKRPQVAVAMWRSTLVDSAIFREWIANVGRRDASTRLAHLLCELGMRLESSGGRKRDRYTMPLNQEQIGDSLSLTAVHVNRTLRGLEDRGLIVRDKREITIPDWKALAHAGDFQAGYLHLGKSPQSTSLGLPASAQ